MLALLDFESFFESIRLFLAWGAVWLLPWTLFSVIAYLLISMPQRRRERARFFLDLLHMGFLSGRSAEETVVGAARANDAAPGVRFHLLAAHVSSGMRLGEALQRVPRLLPPALRGMMLAGEEAGRLPDIVALSRQTLREASWSNRSLAGHGLVLLLVLLPTELGLIMAQRIWLLPKMEEILQEFLTAGGNVWEGWLVFDLVLGVLCGFLALLWVIVLIVVGGPRVSGWIEPVSDWLRWKLPWLRARLQAQFAAMLGLLLDAGVAEAEAVRLAARSTASRHWLKQGGTNTSEAQWRDEFGPGVGASG